VDVVLLFVDKICQRTKVRIDTTIPRGHTYTYINLIIVYALQPSGVETK